MPPIPQQCNHDLFIHHISIAGSPAEWHDHLCNQLIIEWSYVMAKETMDNFNGSQTSAAMVMMESIPCILHLENKMGLKILMVRLKEGLTNVKGN